MLIASGVLGGVGLALNVPRAIWFSGSPGERDDEDDEGDWDGLQVMLGLGVLGFPALAANLTGVGLAASGAYRRGSLGPRVSSATAYRHVVAGAALLGVGIAAQIASVVVAFTVPRDMSARDYRIAVAWPLTAQAGAMITATGGGLLWHGLAQRKRSRAVDVEFTLSGFRLRF